jgi:hypothetical protein
MHHQDEALPVTNDQNARERHDRALILDRGIATGRWRLPRTRPLYLSDEAAAQPDRVSVPVRSLEISG